MSNTGGSLMNIILQTPNWKCISVAPAGRLAYPPFPSVLLFILKLGLICSWRESTFKPRSYFQREFEFKCF